jgi:hypothetical protein
MKTKTFILLSFITLIIGCIIYYIMYPSDDNKNDTNNANDNHTNKSMSIIDIIKQYMENISNVPIFSLPQTTKCEKKEIQYKQYLGNGTNDVLPWDVDPEVSNVACTSDVDDYELYKKIYDITPKIVSY